MAAMDANSPAAQIVAAFNGTRPAAAALGIKWPNIVQYWKKTGRIQEHYKPRIREAAARLGVKLPKKATFDQAFKSNGRVAP